MREPLCGLDQGASGGQEWIPIPLQGHVDVSDPLERVHRMAIDGSWRHALGLECPCRPRRTAEGLILHHEMPG